MRAHQAGADACTKREVDSLAALTEAETHLLPDIIALHTPGVFSYLGSNPADGYRYLLPATR